MCGVWWVGVVVAVGGQNQYPARLLPHTKTAHAAATSHHARCLLPAGALSRLPCVLHCMCLCLCCTACCLAAPGCFLQHTLHTYCTHPCILAPYPAVAAHAACTAFGQTPLSLSISGEGRKKRRRKEGGRKAKRLTCLLSLSVPACAFLPLSVSCRFGTAHMHTFFSFTGSLYGILQQHTRTLHAFCAEACGFTFCSFPLYLSFFYILSFCLYAFLGTPPAFFSIVSRCRASPLFGATRRHNQSSKSFHGMACMAWRRQTGGEGPGRGHFWKNKQ